MRNQRSYASRVLFCFFRVGSVFFVALLRRRSSFLTAWDGAFALVQIDHILQNETVGKFGAWDLCRCSLLYLSISSLSSSAIIWLSRSTVDLSKTFRQTSRMIARKLCPLQDRPRYLTTWRPCTACRRASKQSSVGSDFDSGPSQ